jgi:hypothetical protein
VPGEFRQDATGRRAGRRKAPKGCHADGLFGSTGKQVSNKMQLPGNGMKRMSRKYRGKVLTIMVAPGRVELPTFGLGNRCSIHLSYGANAT